MKKVQLYAALVTTLVATEFGLSSSILAQAQSTSKQNLIFVGAVRENTGYFWRFDGKNATKAGTARWDTCPQGTTLLGHDVQPNGFWLCASPEIANRGTWYFGNVVKNRGYYWEIARGKAKAVGDAKWDTCWEGRLRAYLRDPNGFWVCQP